MSIRLTAKLFQAVSSEYCSTFSGRLVVLRGSVVRGSPNPKHYGLGVRLRKARKRSGLTRRALARTAGLSDALVGYLESDQRLPSVGKIARLASALGVSASWLAYGLGDAHADDALETCEDLGTRLQTARVERARTKAELGRLAGLTATSITQIENGGSSGVDAVEALAQALGVSPGWLAFGLGSQVLPTGRRGRPPHSRPHLPGDL
jgi:transcriptional regulator with XRE-family HTH domain